MSHAKRPMRHSVRSTWPIERSFVGHGTLKKLGSGRDTDPVHPACPIECPSTPLVPCQPTMPTGTHTLTLGETSSFDVCAGHMRATSGFVRCRERESTARLWSLIQKTQTYLVSGLHQIKMLFYRSPVSLHSHCHYEPIFDFVQSMVQIKRLL